MELVPFGTVTEAEARRSGYADREALRAITAHAGPVRRRHARLPHRVPPGRDPPVTPVAVDQASARSTSALSLS